MFLIGTNTADCHPVVFKRIKQRKQSAPDDVTIICCRPAADGNRRLRGSASADSAGDGYRAAQRNALRLAR